MDGMVVVLDGDGIVGVPRWWWWWWCFCSTVYGNRML